VAPVTLQSHEQIAHQIEVLRTAATCAFSGCPNVFKGAAYVCGACQAGVCNDCFHKAEASPSIPNGVCFFGCGRPVERQTSGPKVDLGASVLQMCAGSKCREIGTWEQLDAHARWCRVSPVQCPICEDTVRRCDFRKHLVETHKAAMIKTEGDDTDSVDDDDGNTLTDSDDGTWRTGAWQLDMAINNGVAFTPSVACVSGPCDCLSTFSACQCPFVVARAVALPSPTNDSLCYTHVAVSTVFAEIATLQHPMGFCELSWHTEATADHCGAIVRARSACSGPVRVLSGGGPQCDVRAAASLGQSLCVSHDVNKFHYAERPWVHIRFSSLSANMAS